MFLFWSGVVVVVVVGIATSNGKVSCESCQGLLCKHQSFMTGDKVLDLSWRREGSKEKR